MPEGPRSCALSAASDGWVCMVHRFAGPEPGVGADGDPHSTGVLAGPAIIDVISQKTHVPSRRVCPGAFLRVLPDVQRIVLGRDQHHAPADESNLPLERERLACATAIV